MKKNDMFVAILIFSSLLLLAVASEPVSPLLAVDPLTLKGEPLQTISRADVKYLGLLGRIALAKAMKRRQLAPHARLAKLARQAYRDNDAHAALRYGTRILFELKGVKVSEETEVMTMFNLVLDRSLLKPGQPLNIKLQPIFSLGSDLHKNYTAELSLFDEKRKHVRQIALIQIDHVRTYSKQLSTHGLADGTYFLRYILKNEQSKTVLEFARPFVASTSLVDQNRTLLRSFKELEAKMPDTPSPLQRAAYETIAYHLHHYFAANRSYIATMKQSAYPITAYFGGERFIRKETMFRPLDLAFADTLMDELLHDKPLSLFSGDMHQAYFSIIDSTLQPYRVFLPSSYNGKRSFPLVIMLHGAAGDENSFMEKYIKSDTGENYLKKYSEKYGYIVVSPNGRGAFGMYVGASETDVLDVLARTLTLYNVQANNVFLMGHSMGGIGTWKIGFRHPEKFAALAPIAGQPAPDDIPFENALNMPVLFSYGEKDTVSPIRLAKRLDNIARKQLKNYRFDSYLGDNHFSIGLSAMESVFQFFEEHRK